MSLNLPLNYPNNSFLLKHKKKNIFFKKKNKLENIWLAKTQIESRAISERKIKKAKNTKLDNYISTSHMVPIHIQTNVLLQAL